MSCSGRVWRPRARLPGSGASADPSSCVAWGRSVSSFPQLGEREEEVMSQVSVCGLCLHQMQGVSPLWPQGAAGPSTREQLGALPGARRQEGPQHGAPFPPSPQRSGLHIRAGRPGPKPHQPGLGHICPLWVPASSTDHRGGWPAQPPRAPPAWWPRVLAGCPAAPSPGAVSLEGPLSWLPVSPRGAQ